MRRRRTDGAPGAALAANLERVRSWTAGWECPEVAWPEVRAVPSPWVVAPGDEADWMRRWARNPGEYHWLLEARPLAAGVGAVSAGWWFGADHTFERLEIETRTVADPAYLADRLAGAVHAAGLPGWTPEDVPPVRDWLFEGIGSPPLAEALRGRNRCGVVLLDLLRMPAPQGAEIRVRVTATLTTTALDGSPLGEGGRTVPD